MGRENIDFSLSVDQVQSAQWEYEQGLYRAALLLTKEVPTFSLSHFSQLDEVGQKRFLTAAQVYARSNIGYANKLENPVLVADHLTNAKQAMVGIYHYPTVWQAATKYRRDLEGKFCEFSMEMLWDEVNFTVMVAALTGNNDLLSGAIERLNKIISQTEVGNTRTTAIFDRAQLVYQQKPEAFSNLKESFCYAQHKYDERWPNMAVVAALFTIDSLQGRHFMGSLEGLLKCGNIALHDWSTTLTLPQLAWESLSEGFRHWQWRQRTPEGKDYSYLQLPPLDSLAKHVT